MKRLLALLLTFCLLVSASACSSTKESSQDTQIESSQVIEVPPINTPQTVDSSTDDMEILRALSYGFVPEEIQGDWDKPVTYKQFCTMLGGMLDLTDPFLTDKWESLTANLPNEMMTRQEGMLACLLAGQLTGLNEAKDYTEEQNISVLDPDMDSKLYPDWNQTVTISTDGNGVWDNYIMAGIFYGMRQISLVSYLPLFTLDGGSLGIEKILTREQAIHAAVRLYESKRPVAKAVEKLYKNQLDAYIEGLKNSDEVGGIISEADDRRDEILNTKTDIVKSDTLVLGKTYTGTAYYVSNGGDDNAEGLTPETAWATLKKVSNTALNSGDAVFFERGGVFGGQLLCQDGVTYSAYGEGQKPRIYGSPENGADPNKWSLVDGTSNIWVFYNDMYDTGGIVFNDGEDYAPRMVGFWDGEKYVDIVDKTSPVGIDLLSDLEIFSAVDYSGYSSEKARYELLKKGKLYLRCDSGNPGEVYSSIEFLCQADPNGGEQIVQGADRNAIDNLCMMYTSMSIIQIKSNSIIQNCEAGWAGGAVMLFNEFGTNCLFRVGDGITMGRGEKAPGVNNAAIRNYCHDIYDQAITAEIGSGYNEGLRYVENVTIQGNLTEKSSGGIALADWGALNEGWDDRVIFKNIMIEDNYVMYSGYGWAHITADFDWGVAGPVNNGNSNLLFGFPARAGENVRVKDNVFCLSRYALVSNKSSDPEQSDVFFSGNTYIQNDGGLLAEWISPGENGVMSRYLCDENGGQTIISVLNDEAGRALDVN